MSVSSKMLARERDAQQAVFTHTVGGQGAAEGPTFGVVNPATGQVFAQCPDASQGLLDSAVAAARQAAPAWAAAGFEARRQALIAFGAAITQHADEIAALLTLEQGKPYANALGEVQRTSLTIERTTSMKVDTEVLRDDAQGRVELHYRPLGVAAAITPWNVPIGLAMGKIVHALYTGNTLVLKPSPYTPLATLKLGEVARGVLPDGVLNVVAGGNDLGRWMSGHPGIDKVSFTGSGPTGRKVMGSAAGNLKRVTLELGGNDAAIVLPGADIAAIAPRLYMAAFSNSGQICMAIKRLYVHRSQHGALCDALAALARASVVGDGFQDGVQLGPVQNRAQYEFVRGLLDDTRAAGGRFLSGGQAMDRPGYFIEPTVVTDVAEDSRVVQEEPFGPLLPVLAYDDVQDAVQRANATDFGLSGSAWGPDVAAAAAVAAQLQVGTAWVNQHLALDPFVPFGGAKQSGLGREFSPLGLKSYMEATALFIPART